MKVAINKSHGGFGLSNKAEELYKKLSGQDYDYISRSDQSLSK